MSVFLLWFVTAIYLYVSLEQAYLRHPNEAIIYLGYAIANIGLIRGISNANRL
jgi:hypothetical protein